MDRIGIFSIVVFLLVITLWNTECASLNERSLLDSLNEKESSSSKRFFEARSENEFFDAVKRGPGNKVPDRRTLVEAAQQQTESESDDNLDLIEVVKYVCRKACEWYKYEHACYEACLENVFETES